MKNDFSKSIDLNLNSISEEVLSEKIEEFFEVVDKFTERTRLYEVQTTADDLALERWNTMMKRFGTSIWSCWKRGDITVSEALETLQNRKKVNQWKKQRWDYSQQETKNELDKFR